VTDIYSIEEFVSYLQQPQFDNVTAILVRELVTTEIRLEAGATRYDALTDLSPFKAMALKVAKRTVLNSDGLRSVTIDDYSETRAAETLAEVELSEADKEKIDLIMGRYGAFTVRPTGQPDQTWCALSPW
jgi:hypothetical protein